MKQYKQDFITFMLDAGVLMFGDFVTKSGRKTPFFINTGKYETGNQINKLGEFYANAIQDNVKGKFTVLFGPAYKGIPLVVTAAIALDKFHSTNVSFCFNRKEAKDHGEGGVIIGHKLQKTDKIVIVEDVMTAGTSIHESLSIIKNEGDAQVVGNIISVDRMERGKTEKSAQREIFEQYGLKTYSIVTMMEVVEFLYNRDVNGKVFINDDMKKKMNEYYAQYKAVE